MNTKSKVIKLFNNSTGDTKSEVLSNEKLLTELNNQSRRVIWKLNGWHIDKSLCLKVDYCVIAALLHEFPKFLTRTKIEQIKLREYVRRLLIEYTESTNPNQYETPVHVRIAKYTATKNLWELRMAMESALILHAFGPFTDMRGPYSFIDSRHFAHRLRVARFGKLAYTYWAAVNNESSEYLLVARWFHTIGDTLRRIAWEKQN